MNKFFGIGNLTKDVDLRTTQSGKSVASFTIAVNRRFKDKEGEKQTDFFSIIAWGQLGEMCGRYLAKGKKVAVVGELQTRSYENKQGVKRYVTEIVADEVEFLSPREIAQADSTVPEGFVEIEDSQLPF